MAGREAAVLNGFVGESLSEMRFERWDYEPCGHQWGEQTAQRKQPVKRPGHGNQQGQWIQCSVKVGIDNMQGRSHQKLYNGGPCRRLSGNWNLFWITGVAVGELSGTKWYDFNHILTRSLCWVEKLEAIISRCLTLHLSHWNSLTFSSWHLYIWNLLMYYIYLKNSSIK